MKGKNYMFNTLSTGVVGTKPTKRLSPMGSESTYLGLSSGRSSVLYEEDNARVSFNLKYYSPSGEPLWDTLRTPSEEVSPL